MKGRLKNLLVAVAEFFWILNVGNWDEDTNQMLLCRSLSPSNFEWSSKHNEMKNTILSDISIRKRTKCERNNNSSTLAGWKKKSILFHFVSKDWSVFFFLRSVHNLNGNRPTRAVIEQCKKHSYYLEFLFFLFVPFYSRWWYSRFMMESFLFFILCRCQSIRKPKKLLHKMARNDEKPKHI